MSESRNRNLLVTGCAGFIGWKVTEKLLERGSSVVGIDNLNDYYDPMLKALRLSELGKHRRFLFIKEDITEFPMMERLFREHQFDAVINLAARAGVRASVEDPWTYYHTNVTGTLNLLELCRRNEIKKFVFAGSSSVYGANDVPFSEDDNTDRPLSPYAASKKAAEVLTYTYHYLHNLDVTVLRYFTVYGPRGRPDMSIFKFLSSILNEEDIEVFGDGKQLRDFTYIDDIAEGTIRALAPCGYEIINLGNDNPVELRYVIGLIEKAVGKRARITNLPRHPADVPSTQANIENARRLLNWKPEVSIDEGIRRTAEWYLKFQNRFPDQVFGKSIDEVKQ